MRHLLKPLGGANKISHFYILYISWKNNLMKAQCKNTTPMTTSQTETKQNKNNRILLDYNWLTAAFSFSLTACISWQAKSRNELMQCHAEGCHGGIKGVSGRRRKGGAQKRKKWKRRKRPNKYCVSVSVLSGIGRTFDVVYRVDQREEINTNISVAWPDEHLSDRLYVCSPTFLSHCLHTFLSIDLTDSQNEYMFICIHLCLKVCLNAWISCLLIFFLSFGWLIQLPDS